MEWGGKRHIPPFLFLSHAVMDANISGLPWRRLVHSLEWLLIRSCQGSSILLASLQQTDSGDEEEKEEKTTKPFPLKGVKDENPHIHFIKPSVPGLSMEFKYIYIFFPQLGIILYILIHLYIIYIIFILYKRKKQHQTHNITDLKIKPNSNHIAGAPGGGGEWEERGKKEDKHNTERGIKWKKREEEEEK